MLLHKLFYWRATNNHSTYSSSLSNNLLVLTSLSSCNWSPKFSIVWMIYTTYRASKGEGLFCSQLGALNNNAMGTWSTTQSLIQPCLHHKCVPEIFKCRISKSMLGSLSTLRDVSHMIQRYKIINARLERSACLIKAKVILACVNNFQSCFIESLCHLFS